MDNVNDAPYQIGSKMEIISKAALRYEGFLYSFENGSFILYNVRSFGTENRVAAYSIPPLEKMYDWVNFSSDEITSARVLRSFHPDQGAIKKKVNTETSLPVVIHDISFNTASTTTDEVGTQPDSEVKYNCDMCRKSSSIKPNQRPSPQKINFNRSKSCGKPLVLEEANKQFQNLRLTFTRNLKPFDKTSYAKNKKDSSSTSSGGYFSGCKTMPFGNQQFK